MTFVVRENQGLDDIDKKISTFDRFKSPLTLKQIIVRDKNSLRVKLNKYATIKETIEAGEIKTFRQIIEEDRKRFNSLGIMSLVKKKKIG